MSVADRSAWLTRKIKYIRWLGLPPLSQSLLPLPPGYSTDAMIPELAPELMEGIFGAITADSGDTPTLQACSLAFSQHTALFQRALCSNKPLFLAFCSDTEEDHPGTQKMINTLVDILDANPRFGACLGPDVTFHFYNASKFLSDPRVAKIARCCSGPDSGIVSLTIDIMGDGARRWDGFSEDNRQALEQVIVHSPRLQTLKIESMDIPWAVLLRSGPFLDSLVLQDAYPTTPTFPWLVPLPAAKPSDVALRPVRLGCMSASLEILYRMTEARFLIPDVDGKDIPSFAIDFGHLRGIVVTHCGYMKTKNLRLVLHRANKLEELMIKTLYCKSSALLHPCQFFEI